MGERGGKIESCSSFFSQKKGTTFLKKCTCSKSFIPVRTATYQIGTIFSTQVGTAPKFVLQHNKLIEKFGKGKKEGGGFVGSEERRRGREEERKEEEENGFIVVTYRSWAHSWVGEEKKVAAEKKEEENFSFAFFSLFPVSASPRGKRKKERRSDRRKNCFIRQTRHFPPDSDRRYGFRVSFSSDPKPPPQPFSSPYIQEAEICFRPCLARSQNYKHPN